MSVTGCPLVIEKDTVGMTILKSLDVPNMPLGSQMLQMGCALVNGGQLVRQFRVRNNGSSAAKLSWKARNVSSRVNGPVKLEINVGMNKRKVKTSLRFWDDLEKSSVFVIEPSYAVVPSFGRQSFTVTMQQTGTDSLERAALTARAVFFENEVTSTQSLSVFSGRSNASDARSQHSQTSQPSVPSQISNVNALKGGYKMLLLLEGRTVHPSLQLDKRIIIADQSINEVDPLEGLSMKAHAPLLFATQGRVDVCSHCMSLGNPSQADLTFTISVDGPFMLKSGEDELKMESKVAERSVFSRSGSSKGSRQDSGSSLGKTLSVSPGQFFPLSVVYTPKKDLRETLMRGTGLVSTMMMRQENEDFGRLIVNFSTGPRILVPIKVTLSTPSIISSSPKVLFGVCHVTRACEGTVLLSNPTDVSAVWTIKHVPDAGLGKKPSSIRVRGFPVIDPPRDDPEVFFITPSGGRIEGPTGPITTAMPKASVTAMQSRSFSSSALASQTINTSPQLPTTVSIRFSPKKNVSYCSRYRFTCEYGNSFDILLEGEGTYEEHLHKPTQPPPMPR